MATQSLATKHQIGWVQMKGDSMQPTINPGEWAEVDPNVTTFNGDGIYLVDTGNCAQIKRLKMRKGRLIVVSDNPFYPPWEARDGLAIGGKVVEH